MSGKVTNDQVSTTMFKVDDFRKAVNYENPKNKGYVRFVPDGKGGVTLAKVNNKIDLFINWRTNINAEKNKAIREKFADSLTRELKWADPAKVEKLAESVRLTKGTGNGGGKTERTDALARKEVKSAMLEYDKLVNTTGGRQDMINNLLKDTIERCGGIATGEAVKEMKDRLFPTAEALKEYYEMVDCDSSIDIGQPGHMKMDEMTFKAKLHALEMKCEQEVKRADVESLVKNQAKLLVGAGDIGNDFGLQLMEGDKAKLAGALHYFLSAKGLVPEKEDGGIVGTGGMLFKMFIDDILPELFKKSVADVRNAGENADKELAMEANFSFDAIMDEAEKFMIGARDYINNPPESKAKKIDDGDLPGLGAIIEDGEKLVNFNMEKAKQGYIYQGEEDILKNTNIDQNAFDTLKKDVQNAKGAFNAEGLAKTFAQKFLAERGIGEGVDDKDEKIKALSNTTDIIMKTLATVKTAAQLQFGSAKYDPETGKKEATGQSMGDYVKDMENAIGEIASGKDGLDKELMGRLFSGTLANIATRKVALVASGIGVKARIEKADEEADKALLKATADAYVSFEKKVLKVIAGAQSAFEKIAKATKKKGLIDEHMFDEMLQSATTKFANAHKAALQEFFARSPVDNAADGEKLLGRVFRAKLDEARAELDNELAASSLSRTLGPANRMKLLAVEDRVADALAQPGLDGIKVGRDGFIDEKAARARLAAGELKRLYTATLAAHLKDVKNIDGHKTLTDKFVDNVLKDFNTKAKSLMKSVEKSVTAFLAECEREVKVQVKDSLECEKGAFKGYFTGKYPITDAEAKELVNNISAETMRYKAPSLRANVGEILDAPKSFEKSFFGSENDAKAMAKAAINDFQAGGTEYTIRGMLTVIEDRTKMVSDFLETKDNMTAVDTAVSTMGVFGKGGTLEDASVLEKYCFTSKAMGEVKSRMKALPLVYATGDKGALVSRMAGEIAKAVEKPVAEWAKFRKTFLAKTAAIEQEYAGMGKEKVENVRNWVLSELVGKFVAGDSDARNMDVALGFMRNHLASNLDFAANKIKESFNAYIAKIDQALKPAMDKIRAAANEILHPAFKILSPEGAEHLEKVLIPKLMKDYEYQIYRDPDEFIPHEITNLKTKEKANSLDELVERIKDEVFFSLMDIIETNRVDTDIALKSLIRVAGAGVILDDKAETAAAIADLKTWLATPEGHAKQVAAEKALLDHFAEFGASEYDVFHVRAYGATTPGSAVADFRFAARDILAPRPVMKLYTAFDNNRIGEAKEAFESWVDSHGLSRYTNFLSNTTTKERIMARFAERIKSLQENALDGGENEPILTPAFIDVIDRIIDSDGTNAMLSEWKDNALATLKGHYLKDNDEFGYMINPDHAKWQEGGITGGFKMAVERNRNEILAVLSAKVSEVAGRLDTADGIAAMKEAIAKIDMDAIIRSVNDEVITVVDECFRRYAIEEASGKLVGDYTHAFERQLIKDAIGNDKASHFPKGFSDLLTNDKVVGNAKLVQCIVTARNAIAQYLAESLKLCREQCVDTVVLENSFRATTNACIGEVKKNKALWKNGLESGLKTLAKGLA